MGGQLLTSFCGIAGTTGLFYGCVLLIRELRLSQQAVVLEPERRPLARPRAIA